MSLVLSLKEGDDFWVGHTQFVLHRITAATDFTLRNADTGQDFVVTDAEATEILPDVFASAGDFFKYGMVRVALEAPRSVEILRGARYRLKHSSTQGEGSEVPQV